MFSISCDHCPVCLQNPMIEVTNNHGKFSTTTKDSIVSKCGHGIHIKCALQILNQTPENFKCPKCRNIEWLKPEDLPRSRFDNILYYCKLGIRGIKYIALEILTIFCILFNLSLMSIGAHELLKYVFKLLR